MEDNSFYVTFGITFIVGLALGFMFPDLSPPIYRNVTVVKYIQNNTCQGIDVAFEDYNFKLDFSVLPSDTPLIKGFYYGTFHDQLPESEDLSTTSHIALLYVYGVSEAGKTLLTAEDFRLPSVGDYSALFSLEKAPKSLYIVLKLVEMNEDAPLNVAEDNVICNYDNGTFVCPKFQV